MTADRRVPTSANPDVPRCAMHTSFVSLFKKTFARLPLAWASSVYPCGASAGFKSSLFFGCHGEGYDYPAICTVAWSACTGLYMPRKSRRLRVPWPLLCSYGAGGVPFHGQLLYMSTTFGGGFSGLGVGVGGGESIGKKRVGRLLPLAWAGCSEDCFHPSASVSVRRKRGGRGGYGSWGEESSISQS
jgi:hypothetical protein